MNNSINKALTRRPSHLWVTDHYQNPHLDRRANTVRVRYRGSGGHSRRNCSILLFSVSNMLSSVSEPKNAILNKKRFLEPDGSDTSLFFTNKKM
ncbi:unnamed protein product, partial [Trichogramma brassicae]